MFIFIQLTLMRRPLHLLPSFSLLTQSGRDGPILTSISLPPFLVNTQTPCYLGTRQIRTATIFGFASCVGRIACPFHVCVGHEAPDTEGPALREGSRNERTATSGRKYRYQGFTAQYAQLRHNGRSAHRVRLIPNFQLDKPNIDSPPKGGRQCATAPGLRLITRNWLYIVYIRKQ